MLKWRRDVGQRDIHVDSTSICQCWFIYKIQRWNNVDFGFTLKTILFLYHDAWKIKVYINVDEVTVFQRRNNVSLSTLNQRRNLTLKQRWFWVDTKNIFCSDIMMLEKLESLY